METEVGQNISEVDHGNESLAVLVIEVEGVLKISNHISGELEG